MKEEIGSTTAALPSVRLSYKRISTTIQSDKYLEIKQAGYSFSELIVAGLQHRKGMPLLLERINQLEKCNRLMQDKILLMSDRLNRSEVKK